MEDQASKTFDVIFEGTGTSSGKMRNDIAVEWPMMKERFELATDEGPFHGGDGTAPPPLALFTAALTGCLMTQIRAFSKRLRIDMRGVEVKAKLHWSGEQIGNAPYVTAPVGFSLDVDIDSDASPEDLTHLLECAKKGCFIEQSLAEGVNVSHRLKVNDDWQAID
ncbi:OsmC-like protein [Roseivivax sp. THAF40]|uniref:OsmC family protein n=1 Tax=unclassified Roseivivax TaxID=2639302 RepID=UPI001267DBC3|nr:MULTISPECIES: OsmC family protein [unclassified Roseivivax]QFS82815.1 OsmC-like protein [Roseivivax sp. THAF197b]QFT46584.1 OsmC-like protein [Roseivivax sp. THAF40]